MYESILYVLIIRHEIKITLKSRHGMKVLYLVAVMVVQCSVQFMQSL